MNRLNAETPISTSARVVDERLTGGETAVASSDEASWDTVITPKTGWLSLDLKGLWRYRELLVRLIHRDFRAAYAQTVLGPLWFVIDPLAKAFIFTVVFGEIASIPTAGIPSFLFYLTGLTLWGLFTTSVNTNSTFLTANIDLFGKVYFPRLIVPAAQTVANLVLFLVPLALVAVFTVGFWARGSSIEVTWALALLPVVVLVTTMLGTGLALLVASMTVRYRDLTVMVGYAVGALMFVSPVIIPLSEVGDGAIKTFMEVNPMTPMIEWFRYGILGSGEVSAGGFLYSVGWGVVLCCLGLIGVSRVERTFVDIA